MIRCCGPMKPSFAGPTVTPLHDVRSNEFSAPEPSSCSEEQWAPHPDLCHRLDTDTFLVSVEGETGAPGRNRDGGEHANPTQEGPPRPATELSTFSL